jgi:hypothetical protein
MAERAKTKVQTIIYKTQHRKLKIEQHEPYSNYIDIILLVVSKTCTFASNS